MHVRRSIRIPALAVAVALVGSAGAAAALSEAPRDARIHRVSVEDGPVRTTTRIAASVDVPEVATATVAAALPSVSSSARPAAAAALTIPAALPAAVPTAVADVVTAVRADALALVPSAEDITATLQSCIAGFQALVPAPGTPAPGVPAGSLPVPGFVGGLLDGLLGSVLGGVGGAMPELPDVALPDPAAVQAAVSSCLESVLALVPDPAQLAGLLAPLGGLPGGGVPGLDLDALLALVEQARGLTAGAVADPAAVVGLITDLVGGPSGALGSLSGMLPLIDRLVESASSLVAGGDPLALVEQLLGSLGLLLPTG